jgi:long-chain acyl-CoA synthetase
MNDRIEPRWISHYSPWVPAALPLPAESMIDRFEASAARRPAAPAICYFDRTITFAELDDAANRFATLLADWGVEPGDRIALYLQNVPQFVIAVLGTWKRNAIVVPLNPMFKQQELLFHLEDSGTRVLVCLEGLYDSCAREIVSASPVERVVTTSEVDFLPAATAAGVSTLRAVQKTLFPETTDLMTALRSRQADVSVRRPVGPDEVCSLGYTSGTTGPPKGAVSTHGNFVYNAEVYRIWMRLGDDDKVLGVAPLFHITGMVAHISVAALTGIPLVLFYRFDPVEAFRAIERWKPTMTVGAITAFLALMNHPDADQHDLSCLTRCYSGGAPIAPGIADAFEKRFGIYIHNVYGLTESNSPTHAVPLGLRAPVDPRSGALSVGVPVPGCDARILDLDDPVRDARPGEPGEFAARGPMIFREYWNRPEATRNAFLNGYFLTGDVVVSDERGFFYVVDRKKDMINASGYKVWPREVEDVLYEHPGVKEAAVVGVPHQYRGETVKAFVSLKDGFRNQITEQELITFCKRRIADYKYPRSIEFVEEIPKTVTGKLLRRQFREQRERR